ncbi:hypothetical protein ABZZ47_36790 [Streptomyces sp. NPDC006465]|uniref:hypothetical protein n=1 Tax=Streptomyces sp. NPDC006465 TaxID=3157174 RepID=UPI0033B71F0A
MTESSVVFGLGGAMRGSVYVTGTHHIRHWDQFTAVRACLGPVNTFQEAEPAPAEDLPARDGAQRQGPDLAPAPPRGRIRLVRWIEEGIVRSTHRRRRKPGHGVVRTPSAWCAICPTGPTL